MGSSNTIQMKQTYYTIEVYNRRKWSDKYSCTYSTFAEAEERARELYKDEVEDGLPLGQNVNKAEPIHTCYRIKETTEEITIHELQ
jgi:hypothetical protein